MEDFWNKQERAFLEVGWEIESKQKSKKQDDAVVTLTKSASATTTSTSAYYVPFTMPKSIKFTAFPENQESIELKPVRFKSKKS